MTADPSEDAVTQVTEFTACTRETAIRYLKVKDNNLERAITAIFDGEDISKAEASTVWDDSAWTQDRDGGPTHGPQAPAYSQNELHPLGATPQRGPSPAPSLRQPMNKAQEDDELERALASSRQDLGQETGIVSADGKTTQTTFGPATKSHYDASQWTMTVSRPGDTLEASEVVPDLDPLDRQLRHGEPKFLKPHPSGDYLPSFLTIAHSIPLAREALLVRSHEPFSYGEDLEWWRGHDIRLPRIVNTIDGTPADPPEERDNEVVEEVQRLVAYLDGSHRSYGSADSLARMAKDRPKSTKVVAESLLEHALWTWENAARNKSPDDSGIFHSVAGSNSPQGMPTPDLCVIPMNVTLGQNGNDDTVTLAEVMDNTLWDTELDNGTLNEVFVERCADILPMRVTQATSGKDKLGLVVPPVIHVDRYLKENVGATRQIRQSMASSKQRIGKIDEIINKLKFVKHPTNGKQVEASTIMAFATGHYSGANRKAVLEEREARGLDSEADVPEPSQDRLAIGEKLQALCNSIQEKLDVLEQEKVKTRQLLSSLSQSEPQGLTKHRYTLRGVVTKPNVTYLLRPKQPFPTSNEDNAPPPELLVDSSDPDTPPDSQWWRIEYETSSSSPRIFKTIATQDDVLRAVELEHTTALLVYASDRAIAEPPDPQQPISNKLAEFVDRDNTLFASEVQNATPAFNSYQWSDHQHRENMAADDNDGARWAQRESMWTPGTRTRANSRDSTAVQYEDDAGNGFGGFDDDPPAYGSDVHAGFHGYGGGVAGEDSEPLLGRETGWSEGEVHEIRVDEGEDGEEAGYDGVTGGRRQEMVQTGNGMMGYAGGGPGEGSPDKKRRRSDATMLDVGSGEGDEKRKAE